MNAARKFVLLIPVVAFGVLTFSYAASPVANPQAKLPGNSYYLYTKSLEVNDSGVVTVPSRYQWSVETSWRGVDANGSDLPDTRVMLRLYDPKQNFTALTAQMDLATATKLQQELSEIIAQKTNDPAFQHRPQLYDSKHIPTMEITGVDEDGVAIIKEVAGK